MPTCVSAPALGRGSLHPGPAVAVALRGPNDGVRRAGRQNWNERHHLTWQNDLRDANTRSYFDRFIERSDEAVFPRPRLRPTWVREVPEVQEAGQVYRVFDPVNATFQDQWQWELRSPETLRAALELLGAARREEGQASLQLSLDSLEAPGARTAVTSTLSTSPSLEQLLGPGGSLRKEKSQSSASEVESLGGAGAGGGVRARGAGGVQREQKGPGQNQAKASASALPAASPAHPRAPKPPGSWKPSDLKAQRGRESEWDGRHSVVFSRFNDRFSQNVRSYFDRWKEDEGSTQERDPPWRLQPDRRSPLERRARSEPMLRSVLGRDMLPGRPAWDGRPC